ncbi:hypothetical protein EYF80_002179 [Liparis tanakae]|uniref:Uncharacterized protein n=1 Tax=Liparis tanakae TaxID=230148 RepID=A0A4Z2JDZ8_9TELE|nr:hypothetical protein EYF80_002179 [Liparis tanakae]
MKATQVTKAGRRLDAITDTIAPVVNSFDSPFTLRTRRERLSRPADVFVPKLNGTTARPAGGRATGRRDRHLYRVHDEAESSCELVVEELVSVGFLSLEEVEGTELSAGLGVAVGVAVGVEMEFMQSVDVGLVMELDEVEMVGGRAEEIREGEVMEATGDGGTAVVML